MMVSVLSLSNALLNECEYTMHFSGSDTKSSFSSFLKTMRTVIKYKKIKDLFLLYYYFSTASI
jgi:hypothetical protein